MYSGNAPQSFAPGCITGFDQDHLQPSSTIDVNQQGNMGHGPGNSNNQFQVLTGYRGPGQSQTTLIVGDTKAPSFTDMGPGQGSSYNQDPNRSRGLSGVTHGQRAPGQPPSVGDIRVGGSSQNSDGHVAGSYSKDGKAPGLSDVDRRGSLETGASEAPKLDVPNVQEFVGISLVGKNFRKFYPNAYYREQDEEDDQ